MLLVFIVVAFAYRFWMLGVSIRNEKALKAAGAVEHGSANSRLLAGAHVLFYLAASAEGLVRSMPFDAVSAVGLALYLFGAVMLLVVSRLLGRFWTVKLIIARDHRLVVHPLFRRVRHPNYYLNILPELIGFAVTLHAFVALVVGLAVYLVPLVVRIREEEQVMKTTFAAY
ncbi:isoprenylcysteine carboxylmethyltransferase family protein [Sphingomonas sp. DT-51]|uniref:isoprenylcysteine carboxylmethyltransferase family protein n=1 Tax=Sphingomonas sp. DT-51 TaxID=3396165 RepID=UPI003F198E13